MKVLIGYDGSDSARDAIHGLHRAGLPLDAEFLVVSAADMWPPLPTHEPATEVSDWQQASIVRKAQALVAESCAEAQTLATEGAALVKAEFPDWKVSHAMFPGLPYFALTQPSDGTPDLVVVGSQGRSALARLVLGSVSQNVLTHATCSVRISRHVKNAAATNAPIRIVLGVDGSDSSALAVRVVASRAWPAGTEVKVISVLDARFWSVLANPGSSAWASAWASMGEGEEDVRSWACKAIEVVAEELRSAGLVATPQVEEGNPKRVLVEEAERWAADCIFLGAQGHGGVERFLLGAVSSAVAARSHCSVEVVRQR